MIKEFNEAFGRTTSEYQEREAFVNRAHIALKSLRQRVSDYDQLFTDICFVLGKKPWEYNTADRYGKFRLSDIGFLAGNDFYKTMEVLVAVMRVLRVHPAEFKIMDEICRSLPERATTDLGIVYEDGQFYPKGEPELDKDLINHALIVLKDFPAEDRDLRLALDNHRAGKKTGIVETCYRCVEGLTRQILGNKETLIINRPDLLRRLNLSDHWRRILVAYIDYGNDFGRHASPERHSADSLEVEAYLYQTCLLIRLILKTK